MSRISIALFATMMAVLFGAAILSSATLWQGTAPAPGAMGGAGVMHPLVKM